MDIHPHLLAKGEKNGHISLEQHLKNVAAISVEIARHLGLDERIALEGAVLHDIGKASPAFQRRLSPFFKPRPGQVFRHEIASLFFLSNRSKIIL